jgi:ABC-2 type transport system ATP-binding protein
MSSSPQASAAIETRGLTKRFGEFLAVDHVSMEIARGEVFGFLGPNGSGKTTTLRMLLGLLLPTAGSAAVLGHDPAREAERIRLRIGYMSQRFALYDELTALENLIFYAGLFGVEQKGRPAEVLDELGLQAATSARAGELPGGWRQRLALAVAIVHRPELLILDEPTSGVDPLARRAFWELIYAMADRGVTVVVTTHYMDEAEYCGRIGIMRQARLLAVGTPSELKRTAFDGLAWDLSTPDVLPGLEALQGLEGIQRVGLSGERLRLVTDRSLQNQEIELFLRAAGVSVGALSAVEPTLEDVFLALAGG